MIMVMDGVEIDEESRKDRAAIRVVVARAFEQAERHAPSLEASGVPGEVTLVEWLRDSPAYDPRFALVARMGTLGAARAETTDPPLIAERLAGFVMATWGAVGDVPVLGVGPLAVAPERQGLGIGSALMGELLARAKLIGEGVVVLLGDPKFYGPLGFIPASSLGIVADPQWGDYFQACVLNETAPCPRDSFTYAEPFARLG